MLCRERAVDDWTVDEMNLLTLWHPAGFTRTTSLEVAEAENGSNTRRLQFKAKPKAAAPDGRYEELQLRGERFPMTINESVGKIL